MIKIVINENSWYYDPECPLGRPGGFAKVYKGQNEKGETVAIKKIDEEVSQEAHRELEMVNKLRVNNYKNIMKIHDAGRDNIGGLYYIVMDLAEMNLEDYIHKNGVLDEKEALIVTRDIANGLKEADIIVHRDIKPKNILYHDNVWKLADFGIARFIDATTSSNTLKAWMSKEYAAPEQFKGIRATGKTDIYSLGCVCYFILTGKPPFISGAKPLSEQHLYDVPTRSIGNISNVLHSLILKMLRKDHAERPNLEDICNTIQVALSETTQETPVFSGLNTLKQIDKEVTINKSLHDTQKRNEQNKMQELKVQRNEAYSVLKEIVREFVDLIRQNISNAEVINEGYYVKIDFMKAELEIIDYKLPMKKLELERSGWDIVAGVKIILRQYGDKDVAGYSRSASLWYTDLGRKSGYRWYEVGYWCLRNHDRRDAEPFAANDLSEADLAAAPIMHSVQLAYNPKPIDGPNKEWFFDNWFTLLAEASAGKLARPNHMPIEF